MALSATVARTAPPPAPNVISLTTGNDTIVTPSSGSTVYATAATLNAGDDVLIESPTYELILAAASQIGARGNPRGRGMR